MKKLIFLLLLIPSLLFAQSWEEARVSPMILGGGVPVAGGDSCTGNLLFSWHFENLDVTLGTPAGCSAGDTTATAVSSAVINSDVFKDGSNSGDFPTASDYFQFTVSAYDIVDYDQGRVDFWLYITTGVTTANLARFRNSGGTTNALWIRFSGTDQLDMFNNYGGTNSATGATTFPGGLQASTWYHVIARWSIDKSGDGTNYMKICVDETDGTANCGVKTTAPGAFGGDWNLMEIGESASIAADYHLDLMKIYNIW